MKVNLINISNSIEIIGINVYTKTNIYNLKIESSNSLIFYYNLII